jgi:hypothetical protein
VPGSGDDVHNQFTGNAAGAVFQVGTLNLYGGLPPTPPVDADPWVRLALDSQAWRHVRSGCDVARLRDRVAAVARGLADVRRRADAVLADDPWSDPTVADRFAGRIGWLLLKKLGGPEFVLEPSEAALLALVPLLHVAFWAGAAATLSRAIDPTNLTEDNPDLGYREFLGKHSRLVDRACAPELPDRPSAHREIGWWLFHRWLVQRQDVMRPQLVADLLAEAGVTAAGLDEVLTPSRVRELLYGLVSDPQSLCGTDRLARVPAVEAVYAGDAREENVRVLLLGLVAAVAHATAIPVVGLSKTIPWHLGIPSPVDLDRLRDTVRTARWPTNGASVILEAECQHAAVIEALREHVDLVDTLLDAVRRTPERQAGCEVLMRLPARATAERVDAARDADRKPEFTGWSRFTLDDERVRDLLMGERLYRDRNLAIRELYQNALDACRYRQARELYQSRDQDRPSTWSGRITFTQGVDENGRAYLECRDNGVGMGKAELEGVFSKAGVRFAELTGFREEQAAWDSVDPPIEFHPNSRFGIGALSYFMLADEIVITTCRMPLTLGTPAATVQATIPGPGHLFQIRPVDGPTEPGTTVRLYLRSTEKTSCVQVLRRILGIAEFTTTATYGAEHQEWQPGVFTPRRRPAWEMGGIDAYGITVPTKRQHVTWCEHGGALLVDGLHATPEIRHGLLAGDGDFTGAVVNLTGPAAPDLSVDRLSIVSDVADVVEKLLVEAVDELLGSGTPLPNLEWMSDVGWATPRLADLVGSRMRVTSRSIGGRRNVVFPPESGWFPQDIHLVPSSSRSLYPGLISMRGLMTAVRGSCPDHLYLWRLIANRPNSGLEAMAALVPELDQLGPVCDALPTDSGMLANLFIGGGGFWRSIDREFTPFDVIELSARVGLSPREITRRARVLSVGSMDPERFASRVEVDWADMDLVRNYVAGLFSGARYFSYVASPGQVLNAVFGLGFELADILHRLRSYGFDVGMVDRLSRAFSQDDLHLLAFDGDGRGPWLAAESSIPAVHVRWLAGRWNRDRDDVEGVLAEYGFKVESVGVSDYDENYDPVVLSADFGGRPHWLDRRRPVPPGHLVGAAAALGSSVTEVAARLTELGYQCPERLVSQPADADVKLLSVNSDGDAPWLSVGAPVRADHVVRCLRATDLMADEIASRLDAYGFRVDLGDGAVGLSGVQAGLLSRDLDGMAPWLDASEPVPLMHLVEASLKFSMTVTEVADQLRALGINSPDPAETIRKAIPLIPLAE